MKTQLGEAAPRTPGLKDAVHVAVIVVKSDIEYLNTGDPVRFTDTSCTTVMGCERRYMHGIVDPFLPRKVVNPGEYFYMILRPGLTENLTHTFDIKKESFLPLPDDNYDDGYEDDGCRNCY